MAIPDVLRQDAEKLEKLIGCKVELHENGSQILVLVNKAPLPGGAYTKAESDVLLLTDFQYQMSAMDMFYMEPDVLHAKGPTPPHASNIESYLGRSWRRWSWHRNNLWKVGTDNLISHWAFVEACWAKEASQ